MIREVVQNHEQRRWDDQSRIDDACARLERLDPDLVEWTHGPHAEEGRYISASLLVTDARRPLAQLARLLRTIARQIEQLADERL